MDVPTDAIEAAAEAIRRHNEDGYGCSVCNATGPFGNTSHQAFAALEAAMPAIREHIAQEIEAADTIEDCWEALEIVRGGTR